MSTFTDGTTKFVVTQSFGVLPGTVTAFSGTFIDGFPVDKNTGLVNRGWHLCDGTNGTPDLRNRFIYGGDGTNNGTTGGEASHSLTINELPKFTPSVRTSRVNSRPNTADLWHRDRNSLACGSNDVEVRSDPCSAIGGNQPHNNMPPYYTLAYIMKL